LEKIDYDDAKISFFLPLIRNKKVLDIGVVQHDLSKYNDPKWLHRAICRHSNHAVGIDIDQNGVQFLIDKGYNVIPADAQNFDLNEKFDVVIAGDLLEHLSNTGGFIDSVKRHLKPHGLLAVSTPNPFWWKTLLKVVLIGDPVPHPQHTCWFCEKTIVQLLERQGLSVRKIKYDTIYNLITLSQKVTKIINTAIPLPPRFKHNTLMVIAKKSN
jgi:2-polyprenyl-3-methyl-5-hydroxy-6-metoxy-1,4-benzoquinol methylase